MSTEFELKIKFFSGLSDPSRLQILEHLKECELCVGDIVKRTKMTQSNISNHLACLKGCGLVNTRRDGKFIYYSLSDDRVVSLLSLASDVVNDVAVGIDDCKIINR
ncbi:MAG TPA: metalloregulator ArsR/SmtB family transcription factor [Candidatus Woesebacteria bacterium]|nr:metalloregulator ArsR/SmtB family transcription factor [Candidatus Woesebacteria bacterium]